MFWGCGLSSLWQSIKAVSNNFSQCFNPRLNFWAPFGAAVDPQAVFICIGCGTDGSGQDRDIFPIGFLINLHGIDSRVQNHPDTKSARWKGGFRIGWEMF